MSIFEGLIKPETDINTNVDMSANPNSNITYNIDMSKT